MKLANSIALIAGTNPGLDHPFATESRARSAGKACAGGRGLSAATGVERTCLVEAAHGHRSRTA